jgi:hypothetical protein
MQKASVLVSSSVQLNPPQKAIPSANSPTTVHGPMRLTRAQTRPTKPFFSSNIAHLLLIT